ncbi:MAG: ABC transporter substrate-binding protein [Proteobacteria bacterium]|nr:ABC transporter substrate-binding protein [Pseudomonadota bacterium]MBU4278693.1 ABC transporter substrate-binding protein [Pseudomonadota bacterium]MBU4385090.1 ABC transporter substrate-binding protein [Pseudomonadota bacterium]MCG2763212.1 ABC transporter substrate-binding protein [Desulfarculaceae bacterium]
MKKIAILTTAIIALMATAAWAAGPVKVGVVLPFSGPVGSDGTRTFNGIDLAVKQINAAGGIDFNGQKMPIEIVKEDSTCNPRMSVAAVEKLMTRDKVSVVIGDFCSTSTLADAEVAKRNKVPQITPISIAPPITKQGNQWIFRNCDNSDMMARAFVKEAINSLKIKRWAFLARNDDYGRGGVESLSALVKKEGGEVVAVEYHPQGATDYYTLLTKIRAKKPDGIALIANTAEHSVATNQMAEIGLTKQVRLLDPTSAYFNPDFMKLTGANSNGLAGPTRYVPNIDTPANKKFVEAYQKAYKEVPDKFAMSGYETVYIVAKAMALAKSTAPAAVRDALTKVKYPSVQGRDIYFDKNNQIVLDEFLIQVKDGKYEILGRAQGEKVLQD